MFSICVAFQATPVHILDRCCEELLITDPAVMDASEEKQKMKLLIEKCTPSTLRIMLAVCEALYTECGKE
jgi:hypothetical protein